MDEVEEFRVETRKNLGVFFLDQAKDERKDVTNRKSLLNTETQKWEKIRATAAQQANIANEVKHEII